MKRLLLPFSWVYQSITRLRNHLYDTGIRQSVHFDDLLTISVGNLSMGGTGKTPVTEYLIRLLKSEYKVAALSRGYGRKTKGLRLLNDADVAATAGDEPVQLFRKFGKEIHVIVSEDRILAIPTLLKDEVTHSDIVILDDAFQHRRISPDLNILLTKFDSPFYDDFLFPSGWLRESRIGAKRADVILFTKCPSTISPEQIQTLTQKVLKYSGDVPVFFTRYRYHSPISFGNGNKLGVKIILVTGIAHSDILRRHCSADYEVLNHLKFPDHHNYSLADIHYIVNHLKDQETILLTTEKDMVRLSRFSNEPVIAEKPWYYLPVEIEFLDGSHEFDRLIKSKAEKKLNALKNRE